MQLSVVRSGNLSRSAMRTTLEPMAIAALIASKLPALTAFIIH